METVFGKLPYRAEDYIVIPRGITYRLVPNKIEEEDYLILESVGPVRIPQRYLNHEGQIKMGAPYSERDLHGPSRDDYHRSGRRCRYSGQRWIATSHALRWRIIRSMRLAGMAICIRSPSMHRISNRSPARCINRHRFIKHSRSVDMWYAPSRRAFLDTHPEAVKIPWVHDNVEADEVLFYVRGNFGSRRGIESGSITLHPRGIPHGPHPGTIMASKDAMRTEELAVMFDTHIRSNSLKNRSG